MLTSIIPTFSGRHFDINIPTAQMIDIHDIARALSHECRFAGHVRDFYSIAQHSLECSMLVKRELRLKHYYMMQLRHIAKIYPHRLRRYYLIISKLNKELMLLFDKNLIYQR